MRSASQVVSLLGVGCLLGWLLTSDSCSWPFSNPSVGPIASLDPPEDSTIQESHSRYPKAPLEELQALLANGQYEEALRTYDSARAQNDDLLGTQSKDLILSHARELIGAGQNETAQRLLKLVLQTDYRDVDVLLALAESQRRHKNYDALIQTLYEARANAHRPENLTAIENQIRMAVASYAEQLASQDDQQGLVQLYQMLTGIEPSYTPYFLKLAEVQIALNQYVEASQSLELIRHDPDLTTKAEQLLVKIEGQDELSSETVTDAAAGIEDAIPLARSGGHFLVNAYLNDAGPVTLLIDTGASMTVIKPDALANMGIASSGPKTWAVFNTANGRVQAQIMALRRLTLGNQFIEPIDIAVMDLDGAHEIDGLLGMNALRNFRFFIDQERNTLVLSRE